MSRLPGDDFKVPQQDYGKIDAMGQLDRSETVDMNELFRAVCSQRIVKKAERNEKARG